VEVNLKVAFTCLGGTVLLLLGFRKVRTNREVALITSEGVITATSQDFASLLGETSISTAGKLLSDLCPSLISSRDKEKSVQVRRSPPLYGRLISEKYGAKTVHLAVLYSHTFHSSIAKPVEEISQKEPTAPPSFSKSSWFTGHWPGKQYQTGRDLLIGMKVKHGLNRAYALLASVSVLITLMMLAWTIAIAMYLIIVTQGVIEDSVTVELSARIVHTTRVAGQGRFLDQTNAGFFSEGMTSDVKNVVYQSIVALTEIEQRIWENVDTLPDGEYKDLMLESGVTTWELSGTVAKSHSVNLVNAMKTFLSHSKSLLDFPIANLTIHNPSVFYLVRNGLKGELTQALSLSLSLFKDIEQQTINRNVSSILYLLIAVFASLEIAVAISVPVIMWLQGYVWASVWCVYETAASQMLGK
jgi:hypothetical protein